MPGGLLADTTYLTPNEHEAECLTGIAVGDESTARQAATKLLDAGARHVIITLGAKGAWLGLGRGQRLIASRPVTAVDTTAAGDAFNGGLAWALGRGLPVEAASRPGLCRRRALGHAARRPALAADRRRARKLFSRPLGLVP